MADRVLRLETMHRCPPRGATVMPCCGLTPFEVPRTDRMTVIYRLVTCHPSTTATRRPL